jgi:Protein of unknown function (DUF3810)
MKINKNVISVIMLLLLALLIKAFSINQLMVEHIYSNGIFVTISSFLIALFGWCKVSIGDVLYGIVFLWLLVKAIKNISLVFSKALNKQQYIHKALKLIRYCLWLYIIFNIFWGINYNRIGVAKQLQLSITPYTTVDLIQIDSLLIQKVNATKNTQQQQGIVSFSQNEIFLKTKQAYTTAGAKYPFLPIQHQSLKSSLWGWLGNYTGFLGYYNPLTAEAQVNTTVPLFIQPFVCCHEVAHQMGYAKENEANFVGYLAAAASTDTFFHYSVYLDLFMYAHRALYLQDSALAKKAIAKLLPAVKADIQQWNTFNKQHQNPIEPIIRWIYGKYLLSNQQPAGIMSYDEVTGFLICYYKKYGKI